MNSEKQQHGFERGTTGLQGGPGTPTRAWLRLSPLSSVMVHSACEHLTEPLGQNSAALLGRTTEGVHHLLPAKLWAVC